MGEYNLRYEIGYWSDYTDDSELPQNRISLTSQCGAEGTNVHLLVHLNGAMIPIGSIGWQKIAVNRIENNEGVVEKIKTTARQGLEKTNAPDGEYRIRFSS